MSRIRRFLRSPRTALWLIALAAVWMVLGTIVPQDDLDAVAAAQWRSANPAFANVTDALGLHEAFVHPVFLILAALLAASTAVCAWDRSVSAYRLWHKAGVITQPEVDAMRHRPTCAWSIAGFDGDEELLAAAASALREAGLRVKQGPAVVEGRTSRVGLVGSPLFHWALVGLLIAAPLGWLASSSGLIGVIEGESVIDEPSAYGLLDTGPLHGGQSGHLISVDQPMPLSYEAGGVDRGPAPVVTISDGEKVLASGRVYPNNPLRYGSTTVHMNTYGTGVVLSEETGGRQGFLIDFPEQDGEIAQTTFTLETSEGDTQIEISPHLVADEAGHAVLHEPREIRVTVSGANSYSQILREGESFQFADRALTIERIGYYARLSVVDDPVIAWIYVLFVAAAIGVTIAIAMPYRVVRAGIRRVSRETLTADVHPELVISVHRATREQAFVARCREAIEDELSRAGIEMSVANREDS